MPHDYTYTSNSCIYNNEENAIIVKPSSFTNYIFQNYTHTHILTDNFRTDSIHPVEGANNSLMDFNNQFH